jgi:hypothetical protein
MRSEPSTAILPARRQSGEGDERDRLIARSIPISPR